VPKIIETDILISQEITDPFAALNVVKRAWRHSYVACPKYLVIHKAVPDVLHMTKFLEDNGVVIKDCDCMET